MFPFAVIFWLLSSLRRKCYQIGILPSSKPDAFIIVVGNISVGGNGKTPVVVELTKWFQQRQIEVGVLSRGYGGSASSFPHKVSNNDSAMLVGDEPKLIANRTGVPVIIDPKRTRGAAYLRETYNCKVIICDDGLQHYALKRDMELVVMDNRGVGNGKLLPMGPLREGAWRLNTVDAIIHNSQLEDKNTPPASVSAPQYRMHLQGDNCINVSDPDKVINLKNFRQQFGAFTAMAGIGSPKRFFNYLIQHGLSPQKTLSFSDHHQFQKADIPPGVVLMTEKDAVKIETFGHEQCWYLPIEAQLPDAFYRLIEKTFSQSHYK
nr:tetraacyldisaccharide 4'-kinase [Alteromonas sp. ASW11-130]